MNFLDDSLTRNVIRRRQRQQEVQPKPKAREQLEEEYGQVWDTRELAREFIVTSIIRPLIVVRRKADDVVGTLTVQEKPRFYFGFKPDDNGQHNGE